MSSHTFLLEFSDQVLMQLVWTLYLIESECLLAFDPGFWSGGPSGILTPRGAPSPKFAQNRGCPLKLPENYMILKKSWGQGLPGPQGPLDPLLRSVAVARQPSILMSVLVFLELVYMLHWEATRNNCIYSPLIFYHAPWRPKWPCRKTYGFDLSSSYTVKQHRMDEESMSSTWSGFIARVTFDIWHV